MVKLSKKWYEISSFEDALSVNRDFISGKIKKAPYHLSPIRDTPIKTLYELNNYIFTYDGQSNECVYNIYVEPWKMTLFGNKYKGGGEFCSSKQKNYLEAIVSKRYIPQLIDYLENIDKKLKYVIVGKDENNIFNRYTNVSNDICIYNSNWIYNYSIIVTVDSSSSNIIDIPDIKWEDFTDLPIIQNEKENIDLCSSLIEFYPNFLNDGYNLYIFYDEYGYRGENGDVIDILLNFFRN